MKKTLKYGNLRFKVESVLSARPAPDKGIDWPAEDDMPRVQVVVRLPAQSVGTLIHELVQAGPSEFCGQRLTPAWGHLDDTREYRYLRTTYKVNCTDKAGVRAEQRARLEQAVSDVNNLILAMSTRRERLRNRRKALRQFRELRKEGVDA